MRWPKFVPRSVFDLLSRLEAATKIVCAGENGERWKYIIGARTLTESYLILTGCSLLAVSNQCFCQTFPKEERVSRLSGRPSRALSWKGVLG